MNIVIINEYAGVAEYGMTLRHFYLAKEFVKAGHSVTIVSASFSHLFNDSPSMRGKSYKKEQFNGVDFLWVNTIKYSKSFSKKRIMKWFQFTLKCFFIKKYLPEVIDVVISSPTAPFNILPAYSLAKNKQAKLVFEVRDIWPKTLIEIGKFSVNHPFIKLMSYFELFAIKKCDFLVSNLSNYMQHVNELGIAKEVTWIGNGIDLDEMGNQKSIPVECVDLIPKNKFIVGYTGKIGLSNGVGTLLDAARHLKDSNNIAFVIIGDGELLDEYKSLYSNLSNVYFLGAIPKNCVQDAISYFSVCYIGYLNKVLYKYGIAPNKVFDYLYSGKPIIEAVDAPNSLVEESGCGFNIQSEDLSSLIDTILQLESISTINRQEMGIKGHKYVTERFSYSSLAKKYLQLLQ